MEGGAGETRRQNCLERFDLQTQNFERKNQCKFVHTLCLSSMLCSNWHDMRIYRTCAINLEGRDSG